MNSRKRGLNKLSIMSETKNTTKSINKKKASSGPLSFLSSLCYIWWLETKSTIKDEGVLIFFLVVPLAYPLLYSWIYNNEVVREVPVAIVDLSHSSSLSVNDKECSFFMSVPISIDTANAV